MKIIDKVKKRKYLFISLGVLSIVLSISTVYASLNTEMVIDGEGYVRVEADVRVTGIKMLTVLNDSYETYNSKYTKDSTSMYATLPNQTSEITYQISVTNKSSDTYIISEITDELNNENITYTVDNYKIGQEIPRNSTIPINITFKYLSNVSQSEIITQIATIKYKFEKPYALQLEFDNARSDTICTDAQCALDELYNKF